MHPEFPEGCNDEMGYLINKIGDRYDFSCVQPRYNIYVVTREGGIAYGGYRVSDEQKDGNHLCV